MKFVNKKPKYDKTKNNWGVNLCDTCANAMRWNQKTDDIYSFKRKGQRYERNSRCTKSGRIIDLHNVVKCTHYEEMVYP